MGRSPPVQPSTAPAPSSRHPALLLGKWATEEMEALPPHHPMPPHEAIAAPSWHEPWGLSPAGHQVQTPASCAAPGPHRGGEAPLIHVHAPCQELLRAGLQPQGLRAELAPFPPARPAGSTWARRSQPAQARGGRALPLATGRCSPSLVQYSAPPPNQAGCRPAIVFSQALSPPGAGAGRGLILSRAPCPPSPSTSRPQNGPRGVWAATSPPPPGQGWHEVAASRYCPPGLQKGEACSPLLLLLPQQPLRLLC